jgi:hypothetical protein
MIECKNDPDACSLKLLEIASAEEEQNDDVEDEEDDEDDLDEISDLDISEDQGRQEEFVLQHGEGLSHLDWYQEALKAQQQVSTTEVKEYLILLTCDVTAFSRKYCRFYS